ncbi:Acetylglutamate kinase [Triticum urartu]|uniref:Acetylglutamate kinase n=1 Tax=Triticum urartu TaxID=4572 RepID=M7YM31_TRIUA|nr:Acetylglutamate kinase [Triticum urartu]
MAWREKAGKKPHLRMLAIEVNHKWDACSRKLLSKWEGPYVIEEFYRSGAIKINNFEGTNPWVGVRNFEACHSATLRLSLLPGAAPARRVSASHLAAAVLNYVDVLPEALAFIQRFKSKTVVVKYGGAAMKSPELQASMIRNLVLLSCVGLRHVLVHVGGLEINSWLQHIGVEPQFRNGLRVIDTLTMEVVCEGAGQQVRGFVGEVTRIHLSVLHPIIASGHIPVKPTVAADETG